MNDTIVSMKYSANTYFARAIRELLKSRNVDPLQMGVKVTYLRDGRVRFEALPGFEGDLEWTLRYWFDPIFQVSTPMAKAPGTVIDIAEAFAYATEAKLIETALAHTVEAFVAAVTATEPTPEVQKVQHGPGGIHGHTEATKAQLREKMKAYWAEHEHPLKGKARGPMSDEQKDKIRQAHLRRLQTQGKEEKTDAGTN